MRKWKAKFFFFFFLILILIFYVYKINKNYCWFNYNLRWVWKIEWWPNEYDVLVSGDGRHVIMLTKSFPFAFHYLLLYFIFYFLFLTQVFFVFSLFFFFCFHKKMCHFNDSECNAIEFEVELFKKRHIHHHC